MFPFLYVVPGSQSENPPKKKLNLQNRSLNDNEFKPFAQHINHQIIDISLIGNHLTWRSMEVLTMSNCYRLTSLYLNGNSIGNKGCKILSRANWTHLEYLCLNGNMIEQYGVSHLVKAQWKNLKFLILMKNKIRGRSVEILNRGDFPSLQSLSLTEKMARPRIAAIIEGNRITFEEVKKLVLNPWKGLNLVWMNSSQYSNEECQYLKRVMKDKWLKGSIMLR